MSTDDCNINILRIQAHVFCREGIGTTNVECGNAEEFLGIVRACLLEYLGSNGYRRVDGIANNGYSIIRSINQSINDL